MEGKIRKIYSIPNYNFDFQLLKSTILIGCLTGDERDENVRKFAEFRVTFHYYTFLLFCIYFLLVKCQENVNKKYKISDEIVMNFDSKSLLGIYFMIL